MIFNVLIVIDYFLSLVTNSLFQIWKSKFHVRSKTIIQLFYNVIEIMHISRILNQQSTLHHFINYQLAF